MRRALFAPGNLAGGIVLVLPALDPARDLRPVVAAARGVAWVMRRKG
jgi:hypothetical protein